jgi:hypothetical protein
MVIINRNFIVFFLAKALATAVSGLKFSNNYVDFLMVAPPIVLRRTSCNVSRIDLEISDKF